MKQHCKPYLIWIRSLPCACCGGKSEAHHSGKHGMGQKASDFTAVPLCAAHHREGKDAYHVLGRRRFQERWQLDLEQLVERLNRAWNSFIKTGSGGQPVIGAIGCE